MRRGRAPFGLWRLFTIGATDITVDVSWLIVFGFIIWVTATSVIPGALLQAGIQAGVRPEASPAGLWAAGLVTSLLFFGSILAHEAAHAMAAVRSGIPVRRIRLMIFGGVAEIESEPERPGQEFWITIVGPLTSAALGGLFLALGNSFPPVTVPAVTALWLGQVNLLLAAFNMLPGFPLDGGRILRAAVWAWTGSLLRATRIASYGGVALGAGLAVYGLANLLLGQVFALRSILDPLWAIVLGWFLWSAARGGYRETLRRVVLNGRRVRDILRQQTGAVPGDGTVSEFIERGLYGDGFGPRPVVDRDGTLLGVLDADAVRDVPPFMRDDMALRQAARPLEPAQVVHPNDTLDVVMNRAAEDPRLVFFVIESDRFLGTIDIRDIPNAIG